MTVFCFQENINDKKYLEPQASHTPSKLAEARSVFENGVSTKSRVNIEKEKFIPPPKPPRVAVTEDISDESSEEQLQAAKRKAPSPPKNTKGNKGRDQNSNSVIKRKAPEPPTTCQDQSQIKNDNKSDMAKISKGADEKKKGAKTSQRSSSTDEEGNGNFPPVPVKRERKGSVDDLNGVNKADGDLPMPKPRKKVINLNEAGNEAQERCADNKKVKENRREETSDDKVTIVTTPVGSDERVKLNHGKQLTEEKPHVIQACVVEEKSPKVVVANREITGSIVTVKAVSCDNSEEKRIENKREKTRVNAVKESKTEKPPSAAKVADQDSKQAVTPVVWEKQAQGSSKKPRKSTKREEFAFKVPRRPTKESHFDPNETINLNDVNIHEMTFTFDFGQFDELEKEREGIFQMSYEEKCKQVQWLNLFFLFIIPVSKTVIH